MINFVRKIFESDPKGCNHNVTFFTNINGWTEFTFDDGINFYEGEICIPDTFEGDVDFYIKWQDVQPLNKIESELFIYDEFCKV